MNIQTKAKKEEINYSWLFSLGFENNKDNYGRVDFEKGLYSLSLHEEILDDDIDPETYHTFDLYIIDYEADNSIHWPFQIKYKYQLLKIFDAMEIKVKNV